MIAIIDYGMGNLRSVSKAFEHLGGDVRVTANPEEVLESQKVVLPGVGAFGDAVFELRERGLWDCVLQTLQSGKPFLGICLGLQLLLETSEESPGVRGFGYFPGVVRRFFAPGLKVPHMGWNQLEIRQKHPLFYGVKDRSYFYFIHSYYARPDDSTVVLAGCDYGPEPFAAVMGRGSVFATQFHPEKSQTPGLQILKNFLEL